MSEEKQTKNCPYCGEEILATAKKCKHCGEWLEEQETVLTDEELEQIAEDAVNAAIASMEEKEAKWNKIRIIIEAVVIVFIGIVLLLTVPNEQKHIAKANEYADKTSSLFIRELKQIASENKPALYSVSDLIPEEACEQIRKEMRRSVLRSFKYTNCLLFSVGDIGSQTTQIGVLGFVIDFTPVNEKEIRKSATERWNQMAKEINNNAINFLDGLMELIDGVL